MMSATENNKKEQMLKALNVCEIEKMKTLEKKHNAFTRKVKSLKKKYGKNWAKYIDSRNIMA